MQNKTYKSIQFKAEDVTEKGIVSGVLNTFGNKDFAGDITMKGAFTKSLLSVVKSGRPLVLLWQHDHNKPIGIWKNLRETSRGLEGDAHLNLDVALAKEAFALIKQGALSGFSIGYYVIEESYDISAKANRLHELSLLETSLVTFPCNDLSRTEGIKMKLENNTLPSVRDLEAHLKATGFSNADAKFVVSKYMPDYVDPVEKARLEEEAKEAALELVKGLIEKHALKYVVDVADVTTTESDKDAKEDDEEESEFKAEDEEKPEDEEADEIEKSSSMDAFFTK